MNAIAPTITPTESVLEVYTDEDFERAAATRQLIHRRATIDDVTRTMLFLCSDDARAIHGAALPVTGLS